MSRQGSQPERSFGLGAGSVFPASHARSLLNPLRRLVQSPRRTVATMQLGRDARVLELGCGPGYFSPTLAAAVPDGELVLFDLQSEMLQLARVRLSGSARACCVQGDASCLPFADGSFDAVLVVAVLGEIPDRAAALRELRRVLRRDGALTVCETRRDSDFIALPRLTDELGSVGLELAGLRGSRFQYAARFTPRL